MIVVVILDFPFAVVVGALGGLVEGGSGGFGRSGRFLNGSGDLRGRLGWWGRRGSSVAIDVDAPFLSARLLVIT